jgi:hypothetical protein
MIMIFHTIIDVYFHDVLQHEAVYLAQSGCDVNISSDIEW